MTVMGRSETTMGMGFLSGMGILWEWEYDFNLGIGMRVNGN